MHQLHAIEMGEGAGTSVVFLHGFGGTAASWHIVQKAVSETHSTIAFDLPGHGTSLDYPDAVTARHFAEAVIDEFNRRNIRKAHLVGHSMGGATAALVAVFAPEKVASLTLLAPGGFGPDINGRLLRHYAAARTYDALETALEGMFGWRSPVDEEVISRDVALRQKAGQIERLNAIGARMMKDGMQGTIPREYLEAFVMPVTVAWGRLDNVLPLYQSEGLPQHFSVHRFDGVGHMLIEEIPDQVIRLVSATVRTG
ncbi:alpha/beta fold hydrolase [Phyllobacterium myrsinacearum]|uniref:Pyruvate dehydrogenase E2 component (Dihydrolipoamide acetyltransferase) n=1 Tax=Phyllobacterium myrsinacearum TaxID=28101 RepID=A0A839ET93_9HYPH|nr:alpha/beta fold hydrolase [Phyllobacterium myrsinacearum]MBA8880586.1 pyruvate dehydrogenase E2 component (dihydrolipoamide acetyltransferase) [Phyllobacterium myrsinacearum]